MNELTINGWRLAAALRGPVTYQVANQDGSEARGGLWHVVIQHEDGRVREWENVFFGANERNMLAWCVSQVASEETRARYETDRAEFEAVRVALGLGGDA